MLVADTVLDSTDAGQETRMDQLREEIERGSYRVDPKAVADAILLRLLGPPSGSVADSTVLPLRTSARSPITRRSRRRS